MSALMMSEADLTFGTRTPAAPVSVACWIPLRSVGPPTRMRTGVRLPSTTAVSIPNDSSCESGELIGSMTSQSKPAALIEWATSGEALCSTTPTVGCALSFARKELLLLIVVTIGNYYEPWRALGEQVVRSAKPRLHCNVAGSVPQHAIPVSPVGRSKAFDVLVTNLLSASETAALNILNFAREG